MSPSYVAVIYLVQSFPYFCTNLLVLQCLIRKRQILFKGDFFLYSIHMLLADTISLLSIGFYTSLCLFLETTIDANLEKFFAVFGDIGWYAKSIFLVCIAFSRFNVFRKSQLKPSNATKTTHLICFAIWTLNLMLTVVYLFNSTPVYILDLEVYTWRYNLDTLYGHFMLVYNMVHIVTVSLLLTLFNLLTVCFLYKKRHTVESNSSSQTNQFNQTKKVEKILYVQCLFTSSYFVFGVVVFICVTFVEMPLICNVIFYIMWLSQLGETSFVYLLVNKPLRKSCFVCWN